jgi:hypothetical protein
VADATGNVRAAFEFPPIEDPCHPGTTLTVSVREVDVDPSSRLGDERFVVAFDTSDARGQPLQEFAYDDTTSTLTAMSAPVLVQSGAHPASTCADPMGQGQAALYDAAGNLWVVRSNGISGGPLYIFLRDPAAGESRFETECSVTDPSTGASRPWGMPCTGDVEVGSAINYAGDVDWAFSWTVNLVLDSKTSSVVVFPFSGGASLVEPTPSTGAGPVFTSRTVLDVGLGELEPLTNDARLRSASNGSIDSARRLAWIPISTIEAVVPSGCSFSDCNPVTGAVRDSFLYSADLDRLATSMPRVAEVNAPSSVTPGTPMTIALTTTMTAPFDESTSALRVYVDDGATPVATPSFARSCTEGTCVFDATVPASVTLAAKNGQAIVWHALLFDEAGHALHTTGRVPL